MERGLAGQRAVKRAKTAVALRVIHATQSGIAFVPTEEDEERLARLQRDSQQLSDLTWVKKQ